MPSQAAFALIQDWPGFLTPNAATEPPPTPPPPAGPLLFTAPPLSICSQLPFAMGRSCFFLHSQATVWQVACQSGHGVCGPAGRWGISFFCALLQGATLPQRLNCMAPAKEKTLFGRFSRSFSCFSVFAFLKLVFGLQGNAKNETIDRFRAAIFGAPVCRFCVSCTSHTHSSRK